MFKCPKCGRTDCGHVPKDIGLSESEFLILIELDDDKDLRKDPVIRADLAKIHRKIDRAVRSPNH